VANVHDKLASANSPACGFLFSRAVAASVLEKIGFGGGGVQSGYLHTSALICGKSSQIVGWWATPEFSIIRR